MGLRILSACFCLLIVATAFGAPLPRWTKKFHAEAVRCASIRDSLGVSNDRASIVVWKAETGDSVASFPAIRGDYGQAWLSADLTSVIAVVRESAERPVFLYWISIATGVVTDSFAVPLPNAPLRPFDGYPPYSDISEDGKQLVVTVFWVTPNPPNYTSGYQPTVVDLESRSVKKVMTSRSVPGVRFESHDRKISMFSQASPSDTTWSPSGLVGFDGNRLIDYPTVGERTLVTTQAWITLRWTRSDAVILGRSYKNNLTGAVCFVNLCSGAIIDTVIDTTYKDWGFWSHWDMQRGLTASGQGEIAYWVFPSLPTQDSTCARSSLPDTVVADSVYKLSAIWFPFSFSTTLLFQDDADPAVNTTSLFAWRNEGPTSLRFGRTDGDDTLWTQRRSLYISPRKPVSDGAVELSTGKGAVSHLHTTRNNQILVSTLDGKTLIVDTSLRCSRGFYTSMVHRAAVWNGDSSLLILQTRTQWSGNGPTFYVDLSGIVRKVGLYDFDLRDSLDGAGASGPSRYDEPYGPQFGLLDAQGTESLWHAVSFNNPGQGYGTICEVRTQPLSTVSHSYQWTDLPLTRTFLGHPIGGAINKSLTFGISLQRNLAHTFGHTSRVVAFDIARDTAVASFDNNYSEHAMFMTDNICMIDSMILEMPSLMVRARHGFNGPFALYPSEGYAVVWDSGMYYYLDIDGRVVDSTLGSADKPTVFRVLSSNNIISGHEDGTVRMYHGKTLAALSPEIITPSGHTVWLYPQPTTSAVVVKTSLPAHEPHTTLTLCDNTGRVVVEWQERSRYEYSFDVTQGATAVPPGLYGLRIRCGTQSVSGLILVVR